jgi:hypothetical protein
MLELRRYWGKSLNDGTTEAAMNRLEETAKTLNFEQILYGKPKS